MNKNCNETTTKGLDFSYRSPGPIRGAGTLYLPRFGEPPTQGGLDVARNFGALPWGSPQSEGTSTACFCAGWTLEYRPLSWMMVMLRLWPDPSNRRHPMEHISQMCGYGSTDGLDLDLLKNEEVPVRERCFPKDLGKPSAAGRYRYHHSPGRAYRGRIEGIQNFMHPCLKFEGPPSIWREVTESHPQSYYQSPCGFTGPRPLVVVSQNLGEAAQILD